MSIRPAAVAGSWYPRTAPALAAAVDHHLRDADRDATPLSGELTALIAPHAGLLYSGPVAAHAYRLLRNRTFDVAVLVGPSHYVGFEGVSIYPSGGFETPYGIAPIDADCAKAIAAASHVVRRQPAGARARALARDAAAVSGAHRAGAADCAAGDGISDRSHRERAWRRAGDRAPRPPRAAHRQHRFVALSRREDGVGARPAW